MKVLQQIAAYLEQGGWIMLPLMALSLVMWTLIAHRLRVFARLQRDDLDGRQAAAAVRGEVPAALPAMTGLRAVLLRDYLALRSGRAPLDREILRQCARRLQRGLSRHLGLIAVLAAIAPLLGLLGTVLGMIETFDVIAAFGTGNARALAGGISVALITTQTGLLVAIPGLLMSNRLGRSAQRLRTTLDETTAVLSRHIAQGGRA